MSDSRPTDGDSVGANGVEVVAGDGMVVLKLRGELDLEVAAMVRRRLDQVDGDVTLNCAGLTFIDAAGIRLFFEIDRLCVARGAKLSVVNAPRSLIRHLALIQLDGVFDVQPQDPVA